ncbi:ATP-binding protein [Actinoplanes siamensis]|uniref:Anti-sigma regulatory factor (Ser/Thr protein kinase) n=1 Tax=Actinoplanes siamensis TaxID=1223317 RepID=A0A919NCQ7_9ACTN|nr:ATP-binding protein [Actinoplanes siamensis]GIF08758.1 hypothetical protein Asi03nite_62960 [Actinoplanes siamensis]
MGASPPHLQDETEPSVSVRVDFAADAAVSLLTVCGAWDDELRRNTFATLRRCFTEHPDALIVDLSRLLDPRSESMPVWTTARTVAAALQPPMHLALCVPPDLPLADRMQGLDTGRFLPIYAKVRQARVAVAGRIPQGARITVTLRPDTDAPITARNLVSDACLEWGLAHLLHPARLVISELVTNAVEHAGTEIQVAVVRRGAGLHLSVADGSVALPRLVRPARQRPGLPLDERGHGLQAVDGTAELWGAMPTPDGKVVWATVRARRTAA